MLPTDFDGFDWDDGNWPKCAKHGVERHEIEDIFDQNVLVLKDRKNHLSESRFNAVGTTRAGRNLFVVFVVREVEGERRIRPISARYMHAKEVLRYEQR